MARPTRIALLLALTPGLALASAPADLPTPEQVERVVAPQPLAGLEDEAPAELEPIAIDATRRRETAYRTVQVALDRVRSDKAEDADLVVCARRPKPFSHIVRIQCATNRTWNYIRRETTDELLGPLGAGAAPYALTPGPVYELSPTVLARIGERFAGQDHAARLAELAAEDSVGRLTDEWSTPAETVVRFARAFAGVAEAARGSPAAADAAMAKALADHGFSVEQYNELVARLEGSGQFQRRVAAARQAYRL